MTPNNATYRTLSALGDLACLAAMPPYHRGTCAACGFYRPCLDESDGTAVCYDCYAQRDEGASISAVPPEERDSFRYGGA